MLSAQTVRPLCFVLIVLASVLLLHGICPAQTAGDAPADSPASLQKKIQEDKARLQEEMAKADNLFAAATGDDDRRSFEELTDLLQKIDIVYEQQLVQIRRSIDLANALEQVKKETAQGPDASKADKGYYPFSYLDELTGKLFLLKEQTSSFEGNLVSADAAYQSAREKLEGKEQDLRRIREEHEGRQQDPLQSPAVMVAQWSRRLAEEELSLRKYFTENERLENAIHRLRLTGLQRMIDAVQGRVRFARSELEDQLTGIDNEITGLKRRLEQAKEKKQRAELRWQKGIKQSAAGTQPQAEAQVREKEVESQIGRAHV